MNGRTFDCGGPDRCLDDLCHGAEVGICGRWSTRLLEDDWGDEDEWWDDDREVPAAGSPKGRNSAAASEGTEPQP